jgi:hypothetical protein
MRLVMITVLVFANVQLSTIAAHPVPQQEDGWAAIRSDDGIVFVWNVKDTHFTLAIKGKEIKPLNDPEHIFFSVDGMVFQVQMVAISEFAPNAREKKLDDKAILAAHRDWESKFLEDLLKTKLNVRTFNVRLTDGRDASLWQYDMPVGTNADAKQQVYLTAVNGENVLLLNIAVTSGITEETARKYLLDTMATLKSSPAVIDVQKLADAVRSGAKP